MAIEYLQLRGLKVPKQLLTSTDSEPVGKQVDAKRKASANARMFDKLKKEPAARFWSASEWATALAYKSASTIKETDCWKELHKLREAVKAERGLNKAERAVGNKRR